MENNEKEFEPSWGVLVYFNCGNSPNILNGHFTLKLDNLNHVPTDHNVMTQSLIYRIQKIGSESYANFIMTGFNFIWIDVEIN